MVDLNRPSDDVPLYAGATTGLISTIDFDGSPLYLPDREPGAAEREQRVAEVWEPYHAALRTEVDRIRAQFGYCLLLDLHSIRSRVPRLFEGTLPDLNLGTNSGSSGSPDLIERVWKVLQESGFSAVKDARFKGGFITRHYGRPAQNVHALQIEIAQRSYMEETPPWRFNGERAQRLQAVLADVLAAMEASYKAGWAALRRGSCSRRRVLDLEIASRTDAGDLGGRRAFSQARREPTLNRLLKNSRTAAFVAQRADFRALSSS